MSAGIPIYKDIQQHKKVWQELFFSMTDGDPVKMNEIKRMDVTDFWGFFDLWRMKQKSKIEEYNNKKRQLK